MDIGGIAWWLLVGMFGFGTAVGLVITVGVIKNLFKSDPSDWWGPLIQIFCGLFGMLIIGPLAGLIAVALTFVAHHIGWDRPLPYMAAAGLVFLTWLAGWVLWTINKPSPNQIRHRKGSG